jgi:hypothetical protein
MAFTVSEKNVRECTEPSVLVLIYLNTGNEIVST